MSVRNERPIVVGIDGSDGALDAADVRDGNPADVLRAHSDAASLPVVGDHRRGGFAGLLVGSSAVASARWTCGPARWPYSPDESTVGSRDDHP